LEEVYGEVSQEFGHTPLYLELIQSYEDIEDVHLTLFIVTNLDVEEASEKLDQLCKKWWFKLIKQLPVKDRSLLNINLEFRSDEF
jgi:hypothetical protein